LGVLQQFGAFKSTVEPGPTFVFKPFQKLIDVNVENIEKVDNIREKQSNREMLTQDENIIIVKYEIQFKVSSPEDFIFNVQDPVDTLEQTAESTIREIVGRNNLEFIVTSGKDTVASEAKSGIQRIIDQYEIGLQVQRVNLTELQFPAEVQSAIDDVSKAREDNARYINEAEAYRNQVVPEAGGQAAKLTEEAKGYLVQVVKRAEGEASRFNQLHREYKKAPRVTRDRMYIDAVEEVLGNTSKVVVDTNGGNSMIYLPLDKMINQKPTINNTLLLPADESVRGVAPSSQSSRGRTREIR
jgi:membrane protease subunit HflK